jgi:hypothetical protein
MKKIGRLICGGIAAAIGGMIVSDFAGMFFNGMDYGSACVLGICMYLCAVVVICTGIIVSKLDHIFQSELSRDK